MPPLLSALSLPESPAHFGAHPAALLLALAATVLLALKHTVIRRLARSATGTRSGPALPPPRSDPPSPPST